MQYSASNFECGLWSIKKNQGLTIFLGQKTVVFDWSSAPIFYSGSGSLEISDFRGEFWVEDATQSRLPHAIAAADLSDRKQPQKIFAKFPSKAKIEFFVF